MKNMLKGLFVKDLKFMKLQIPILIISIVCAVFIGGTTFVIPYMTIFSAIIGLSSINYDEFDNGYAYLFSLPITREKYIFEKYLFSLSIGLAGWILSILIVLLRGEILSENDMLQLIDTGCIYITILFVIISVMIPVEIKFGKENKIISIILASVIGALIGFVVFAGGEYPGGILPDMGIVATIAIRVFSICIMFAISYRISVSIIKKKDF